MIRPAPRAAAAALVLAAVACSPSLGRTAQGREAPSADLAAADVTVVARDVRFVSPPRQLPSGSVTLGLDNQGWARHDLTIERESGQGAKEITVASASGGRSSAGTVTLTPGDYVVFCSVGGHRQAGMEFDIKVG